MFLSCLQKRETALQELAILFLTKCVVSLHAQIKSFINLGNKFPNIIKI